MHSSTTFFNQLANETPNDKRKVARREAHHCIMWDLDYPTPLVVDETYLEAAEVWRILFQRAEAN